MASKYTDLQINISEETLQRIDDEVNGRTAEELKAYGDDNTLLMKKYSLDFIRQVNDNLEKIRTIEQYNYKIKTFREQLREDPGNKGIDVTKTDAYIDYKQQLAEKITIDLSLDEFLKYSMLYNNQILSLITGKPLLISIAVPDSGDGIPLMADFTLEELFVEDSGVSISQDITSGKIPRISGRFKIDINKIKLRLTESMRKETLLHGQQLVNLNNTYVEASKDFKEHKPYAFWKPTSSEHWFKIWINGGQGDISEAYMFFAHQSNEEGNFLYTSLYDNLDFFFREGVAKVDNISGVYSSDFITDEYAYAAKSLDASLPGFRQMILLAQKILNGKIKTVEELKMVAARKQWKDPKTKTIQKGLRNKIIEATDYIPREY